MPRSSSSSSSRSNRPTGDLAPTQASFFDKTPAGNAARAIYLKTYIGGTVLMVIMIFTILPIYWGSLYKIPARNLHGWVVDFDGGIVGEAVSVALSSNRGPSRITWTVRPASDFPNGPGDLSKAIRHEDSWAAISINPGSSARLSAALQAPDPTYDGSQAITAYAVEARNENAFRGLIRPSIQGSLDLITRRICHENALLVANSPNVQSILAESPQTIVSAVGYVIDNLVPFDQPVATAATFVGMLYQLILGFFVVMVANGAREASGYHKTLSTRSLIVLRLASSFLAYFVISLFYCLLNLAFSLDVTRKFGRGGFMVFWLINYVGMLAVALALESLITLLTPRGMPFFMLLWIIANLSVSIFPIDVLPVVYRYGVAAPFYNLSRALRTIIFGTRDRVGESVGILFAWIAISCISLALIQWFVRRTPQPAPTPVADAEKQPSTSTSVDQMTVQASDTLKFGTNKEALRDGASAETLQPSNSV